MAKKSQAALEFLTTYAWAFLVIIIMVASLAYFGILRPQQLLPDRCSFNVGFGCEAFTLRSDGLNLKLKNNMGKSIRVASLAIMKDDGTHIASGCSAPTMPVDLGRAEVLDFEWTGCSSTSLVSGEKSKLLVNITYYSTKDGPDFDTTVQGEVFAHVSGSLPSQLPTVDIKADGSDGPITLTEPADFQLSWSTTNNPDTCTASGDWSGSKSTSGGSQDFTSIGQGSYTYTLDCSNTAGSDSDSVVVNVNAQPPAAIHFHGWESGLDGWNDPGSDATLSTVRSRCDDSGTSGGSQSMRLRDNSGSSYTEQSFDFTGYSSVDVTWSAYYEGLESGECLEIKCDGNIVKSIGNSCAVSITQDAWLDGTAGSQFVSMTSSDCTFDGSVTIRFEAEFTSNGDEVWIDCINVTGNP